MTRATIKNVFRWLSSREPECSQASGDNRGWHSCLEQKGFVFDFWVFWGRRKKSKITGNFNLPIVFVDQVTKDGEEGKEDRRRDPFQDDAMGCYL